MTATKGSAERIAPGGLCRAGLCRRTRQADRGLPGATGRGLDLRPHHRRPWRGRPLHPRVAGDASGRHRRRRLGHLYLSPVAPRPRKRSQPDAGADRQHLAQLPHRATNDPLVGRHRQLDRAHRLFAAEERHPGAGERLDRAERHDGCRADRLPDLHRRLGDDRARAIPSAPPTSPAAPGASVTTARRSTAPR